ncbi:MAG: AEC family transporter [Eubacteriales bacterium]|nr:AEC family transporter [Eubacteriales bacterium]
MVQNFVVCSEAVIPLFLFMLIGMGIRRAKLLTPHEIGRVNHMVFVVFFPVMMFTNLYGHTLKEIVDPHLVLFVVAVILGVYFASIPIVLKMEPSPQRRGAMIQAIYRSNFIIMGLPVAISIFGREHLAVTMMMIAIVVPMYNVMAVITLEIFRGGSIRAGRILLRILTNPLILGAAAGLAAAAVGLHLPQVLDGVITEMADMTSPLALIILGASFNFKSLSHRKRDLVVCLAGKLLAVPGIGLTLAMMMGFRGVAFVTCISIFAAPTAVSSFAMAESMGSDGELAGACVVFSSAFSIFTMFFWLFLFKNLGMF